LAHTIQPGPLPNIVIVIGYSELTKADISLSSESLGLDQGQKYLLIDGTKLQLAVPEDFLNVVRQTPLAHPNCVHVAVVLKSELLKNVAGATAKVLRIKQKMSYFTNYDEALKPITALAQTARA